MSNTTSQQETASTPATAPNRTNTTACIRCRQKKRRCDQKLPRCRLCEIAGVECFGYDAAARRQVPRSYIHSLEQRVAYLELRLREHGAPVEEPGEASGLNTLPLDTPSPSQGADQAGVEATSSIESTRPAARHGPGPVSKAKADRIVALSRRQPGHEPSFSQVLLAELMRPRTTPQLPRSGPPRADTPEGQRSSDIVSDLDTSPVSLPAREAAEKLVKAYFQFTNLGMPLLHEGMFQQRLELLYSMPDIVNIAETHTTAEARLAVFFVLEVFAISILALNKQDPSRIPTWLADRYHGTAMLAFNEVGLPINVEGVQALLLIGLYSYHHPTIWDVWKTVGMALRLAVELGLHQDHASQDLDFLTLDTMRRTFWVAYAMDRNISIALSIPSCLPDGAISAKFPSEVEDELITLGPAPATNAPISGSKCVTTHLFRYRKIQSEMQTALYERPSPPFRSIDLGEWQQDMHRRIETWYNHTPKQDFNSYEAIVIDTLEVAYQTALLYLYRPSPNIPCPSQSGLMAMTQAATRLIQLYRRFFGGHALSIYWLAVENLSSAGTSLLYGYVQSPQVRESIPFHSLELLVNTCSSVLWGMIEHFPAFKGKRDAFDTVSSQILADLRTDVGDTDSAQILGSQSHPHAQHDYAPGDGFTEEAGMAQGPYGGTGTIQPSVMSSIDYMMQSLQTPSLPTMTAMASDVYPDLGPFSFTDLDDLPLVWEAVANANGGFTPAWT